jgi:circadian clock protein KaiC
MGGATPEIESSKIHISTLADTWIHLSHAIQGGERNRALSVIKSRGTAHSNQVRELVMSDQGVTLTDVYISQGEVLMGALRLQKEEEDRFVREQVRTAIEKKKRELESTQRELEAKIQSLQRELEANRAEFDVMNRQQELREHERGSRERALREIRGADETGQTDR